MTREQFLEKCKEFEEKGYKRNFRDGQKIDSNGTHYYYKVIEYADNEYGETRAINMLLFKIYNFEDYYDRVPAESMYAFEPVVMFSRTTDERIDLILSYPKFPIEYLEEKAKSFGEWAKKNIELKSS